MSKSAADTTNDLNNTNVPSDNGRQLTNPSSNSKLPPSPASSLLFATNEINNSDDDKKNNTSTRTPSSSHDRKRKHPPDDSDNDDNIITISSSFSSPSYTSPTKDVNNETPTNTTAPQSSSPPSSPSSTTYYPPSSSAYLRHLSSLIETICFDTRWNNLFPPPDSSIILQSFLPPISHPRAMHLYARLFHRKGPWFRWDDLLSRYYYNNNNYRQNDDEGNDDNNSNEKSGMRELMEDINYLSDKKLIRFFKNDEECAIIAGNNKRGEGGLLTQEERNVLMKRWGSSGGRSSGGARRRRNEVWERLKYQPSIKSFFKSPTKTTGGGSRDDDDGTLRRFVGELILSKHSSPSITTTTSLQPPPLHTACLRLDESHLQLLRRVCRLYNIASHGPSSRGISHGWTTVNDSGVRPDRPYRDDWCHVAHVGLNHLLGLVDYPFVERYRPLLERGEDDAAAEEKREEETKMTDDDDVIVIDHHPCRTSTNYDTKTMIRVFNDCNNFEHWEMTVEMRACLDQWLDDISSNNNSTNNDEADEEEEDCEDRLRLLTMEGRRTLFRHFNISMEVFVDWENRHFSNLPCATTMTTKRAIVTMTLLATAILSQTSSSLSSTDRKRPWLRHLQYRAVLARIGWDGVAVLEKEGCYELAVMVLMILLEERFSLLLSRRTRGKATTRLIIDQSHINRRLHSSSSLSPNTKKPKIKPRTALDETLPTTILSRESHNGATLPLSTLRYISQKLKQKKQMSHILTYNIEAMELGLRLDFTPTVDISMAQSTTTLSSSSTTTTTRCRYVGHEDDDNGITHRSLTVEELALEEYATGRFGNVGSSTGDSSSLVKGGWKGWHDEGGHVRLLFRILCLPLLKQRDYYYYCNNTKDDDGEDETVFLTPFVPHPLDLPVAAGASGEGGGGGVVRGFYERRRGILNRFFQRLERRSPEELVTDVHDAIVDLANGKKQNEAVVSRVRELSLVAAGLGGRMLACIFRAFCFDYRYYGGGLPDLLLVRALVKADDDDEWKERGNGDKKVLDLGGWMGEPFSSDSCHGRRTDLIKLILDDDDGDGPFLLMEPKKSSSEITTNMKKETKEEEEGKEKEDVMVIPDKLSLVHKGQPVTVECMFVEVKSANDHLDARQEDWLNLLDGVGTARVCKFKNCS